MTDKYWVGGTNPWNGTAASKWSLTSGGAGGAAEPVAGDDVFFNAASGVCTVTITGFRSARAINFTGFTGSITDTGVAGADGLLPFGSLTLATGMTITRLNIGYSNTGTFTSNGKTITSLYLANSSITVTLGDDAAIGNLEVDRGTFNANNHNLSLTAFQSEGVLTRAVTMGSGMWSMGGTGTVWSCSGTGLTLTPGTSTIYIYDTTTASKTFAGGSLTYASLLFAGVGTGTFILTGSNTFTNLTVSNPPHTIQFESGSTQVVTGDFEVAGTALAGLMTLEPTASAHWNISATGGSSRSYLSLRGSHAHGGIFTAANSFDAGDNFNWDFVRSSSTDIYFDSAYQYNGSATATLHGLNWLIGETLGVVADGVDIGDAVVSSAGNLTLPSSATGSIITVGKRYLSRAVTLRAPQTGNQDGASLGRQMNIKSAAADILDTPYLKVGTLTGTEIIPPSWRGGVTGDGGTGLYAIPIDDSYMNEGVIVFESDKGYPAVVRAVRFSIESEP